MLLKSCQFFNRHLPNVRWSAKKFFLWKNAIFHSIKPPFDAEVAEKFLNGIYSICISLVKGINSPWIWWRSWRSGRLQMWIFILCNWICPIFASTSSRFRFRRFWGGWRTTTFCRSSGLFFGCLLIYLATNTFPRPLNKIENVNFKTVLT